MSVLGGGGGDAVGSAAYAHTLSQGASPWTLEPASSLLLSDTLGLSVAPIFNITYTSSPAKKCRLNLS